MIDYLIDYYCDDTAPIDVFCDFFFPFEKLFVNYACEEVIF